MARTLRPSRADKLQLGLDDEFISNDMLARFGDQYGVRPQSYASSMGEGFGEEGPDTGEGDPEDMDLLNDIIEGNTASAAREGMARPGISPKMAMSEEPNDPEYAALMKQKMVELLPSTESYQKLTGKGGEYEGGSGAPNLEDPNMEDIASFQGPSMEDIEISPHHVEAPGLALTYGAKDELEFMPEDEESELGADSGVNISFGRPRILPSAETEPSAEDPIGPGDFNESTKMFSGTNPLDRLTRLRMLYPKVFQRWER